MAQGIRPFKQPQFVGTFAFSGVAECRRGTPPGKTQASGFGGA